MYTILTYSAFLAVVYYIRTDSQQITYKLNDPAISRSYNVNAGGLYKNHSQIFLHASVCGSVVRRASLVVFKFDILRILTLRTKHFQQINGAEDVVGGLEQRPRVTLHRKQALPPNSSMPTKMNQPHLAAFGPEISTPFLPIASTAVPGGVFYVSTTLLKTKVAPLVPFQVHVALEKKCRFSH